MYPVNSGYQFSLATDGPYQLRSTMSSLTTGMGDPTADMTDANRIRIALRSPGGYAVLTAEHIEDTLHGELQGDDVDWFVPHLPGLLGLNHTPPDLGGPRALQSAALRYQGMRLPLAPLLFPRIVQVMLQQLISFRDAAKGWRTLLRKHGQVLPEHDGLIVPPSARQLLKLPQHEYIACNILPQHGRRIAGVARHAARIENTWSAGSEPDSLNDTCRLLGKLPGIGPWTIGYLSGSSMGDADAVVTGDYSLPSQVAWFFRRETEADDATMLDILKPFQPHRYYALLLVIKAGNGPPRRGPRTRPISQHFRR